MQPSSDRFWSAVSRWESDHVVVKVEFEGISAAKYEGWTVEGTVSFSGSLVTFRAKNGEEKSLEFGLADIRFGAINRMEAVDCFRAMWPGGAECTLSELRTFGKPV